MGKRPLSLTYLNKIDRPVHWMTRGETSIKNNNKRHMVKINKSAPWLGVRWEDLTKHLLLTNKIEWENVEQPCLQRFDSLSWDCVSTFEAGLRECWTAMYSKVWFPFMGLCIYLWGWFERMLNSHVLKGLIPFHGIVYLPLRLVWENVEQPCIQRFDSLSWDCVSAFEDGLSKNLRVKTLLIEGTEAIQLWPGVPGEVAHTTDKQYKY
jgi:hypothetical protein